MVNLRDEFSKIINDYGHEALLVRTNLKKSCNCVKNSCANSTCNICLGTGYINTIEKIKLRTKISSSQNSLKDPSGKTIIGILNDNNRQFYLSYNIIPKINDLIILCGWDNKKPILDDYTEIYKIDYVEPLKGDNGKIEYMSVITSNDVIHRDIKIHNLLNNNNSKLGYIAIKEV